jgi:hypothetical protein
MLITPVIFIIKIKRPLYLSPLLTRTRNLLSNQTQLETPIAFTGIVVMVLTQHRSSGDIIKLIAFYYYILVSILYLLLLF